MAPVRPPYPADATHSNRVTALLAGARSRAGFFFCRVPRARRPAENEMDSRRSPRARASLSLYLCTQCCRLLVLMFMLMLGWWSAGGTRRWTTWSTSWRPPRRSSRRPRRCPRSAARPSHPRERENLLFKRNVRLRVRQSANEMRRSSLERSQPHVRARGVLSGVAVTGARVRLRTQQPVLEPYKGRRPRPHDSRTPRSHS